MKRWTRIAAYVGMIAGAGVLAAAALQPKPATAPSAAPSAAKGMPCVVAQEIETDAPKSYAMWMAAGPAGTLAPGFCG